LLCFCSYIVMTTFAAIDFETANHGRDSACAVGVVVARGYRIFCRERYLIRPPARQFFFTRVHGLRWEDVQNAPTFVELWPTLRKLLAEADFLAAHNAGFDRSVLEQCCRAYRLRNLPKPFVCTMAVARKVWKMKRVALPNVCRRLRIPLRHHEAASDAEASARIVIAARKKGWQWQP
jgi:DNA polymerase III subunit epsilon